MVSGSSIFHLHSVPTGFVWCLAKQVGVAFDKRVAFDKEGVVYNHAKRIKGEWSTTVQNPYLQQNTHLFAHAKLGVVSMHR